MRTRNHLLSILAVLLFSSTCVSDASAKSTPNWEKELAKGYQQLSIGNKEVAAEMFKKKTEKYPGSGACHTALGRALKRLGKLDEAKKEFHSATQVEPGYADGFYEYGCSLESDQQYKEAIDCFKQYLSMNPDASKRKNIEDRIRFCEDKL